VRECHQQGDERRIGQIIDQLSDMFSSVTNALHIRNGGLIGLAGTAIALGVDIAPYMERFLESLLVCFSDPENRVRYFAAECLYNIAKVSKGEVLVYFNPIFDALSKVSSATFLDTPLPYPIISIIACGRSGAIRQEWSRAPRSPTQRHRCGVCLLLCSPLP
jgi:hypothetical protein